MVKAVRGTWKYDIFESGVLTDETGKEHRTVNKAIGERYKRKMAGLEANRTIYLEAQRLAEKRPSFFKSNHYIDSRESPSSPRGRMKGREE